MRATTCFLLYAGLDARMVGLWLEQFLAGFFNLRDIVGPSWPLCPQLEN